MLQSYACWGQALAGLVSLEGEKSGGGRREDEREPLHTDSLGVGTDAKPHADGPGVVLAVCAHTFCYELWNKPLIYIRERFPLWATLAQIGLHLSFRCLPLPGQRVDYVSPY